MSKRSGLDLENQMNQIPKLVVLDRDGVINEDSDDYIKSPEEWEAIPSSLEAIARLNHAGVTVAVATNQSGIGRGLLTIDDLNQIHAKFQRALARVGGHVQGIFFCPHAPEADCSCRKPAPGLLHSIEQRFSLALTDTPFIGDSQRDAQAAIAAKAKPVMVRTGKGMRTLLDHPELAQYPWYDNLGDAVDALLGGDR